MYPQIAKLFTSPFSFRRLPAFLLAGVALPGLAMMGEANANAVANVDSGLQKLMAGVQTLPVTKSAAAKPAPGQSAYNLASAFGSPGRFDAIGRVLVHVNLDGTKTVTEVAATMTALKGQVLATNTAYRKGILAVYLPIGEIAAGATAPGVRSLMMEHRPTARVGRATSQATTVLRTEALNEQGIRGDGVVVGVLSDSFNTAVQTAPVVTAANDVATGDLPVVNVLQDYPGGTDEGRAMCQIVHDEAPHAGIAFATAYDTEINFANNIVALRSQAGASVIVDDVGYFDEPVFSDGLVAQAVNAVATSTTLPGVPAVYCSSAGNDGNNAYRSDYRNLSDYTIRQPGNHGNLKLNVTDKNSPYYLDPSLTAGGWFNWNTVGGSEPFTNVMAPGPTYYGYAIFLQWDDLFDLDHGITTGYNFLVFDAAGNYLSALSSTSNAFAMQEPFQAIGYLSLGTQYQIAITAITQKDPLAGAIPKTHHIALYTDLDGASNLEGTYFTPAPLNVPNIIGHPAADGAIATAAYAFSWRAPKPFAPQLENYSSPGPVYIYFDQNFNRLTTPIVRAKPEVAGVDGVVTTFFGNPYYNYPYAFFGTSAAAPSVAAVAALMIQAAGGPGSIDPPTVKAALEYTTAPRNSTVEQTTAYGTTLAGTLSVTATGQSYFPSYITVHYYGPPGDSIQVLTIDGGPAGLAFYPSAFALDSASGIAPASITVVPGDGSSKLVLKFAKGTMTSGDSFSFEVSQDPPGSYLGYKQNQLGVGDEAEDLAYGATVTAIYSQPLNLTKTLPFKTGPFTYGYLPSDGYGLIDAVNAVDAVKPVPAIAKLK